MHASMVIRFFVVFIVVVVGVFGTGERRYRDRRNKKVDGSGCIREPSRDIEARRRQERRYARSGVEPPPRVCKARDQRKIIFACKHPFDIHRQISLLDIFRQNPSPAAPGSMTAGRLSGMIKGDNTAANIAAPVTSQLATDICLIRASPPGYYASIRRIKLTL
jgi:hypothetical protein